MSLLIDIRKLRLFNEMARKGGTTVARDLGQMIDVETETTLTRINFIDHSDLKAHVGEDERIGISVELVEPPHGHILFLLDGSSAKYLASRMVGDMGETSDGTGFSEMEKSAIQEIANIMTSAFIDGWANALNTTIDISTPSFSVGRGDQIVDELLGSMPYELALLFDSEIRVPDSDVRLMAYMFPDLEELVELMNRMEA
ncbi:MAG: chemotaxis protein CheC [Halobacteriales archaeon]